MSLVLTILEATRKLGFASDAYTRRLVKAGTLRAELVGGRYEIDDASVDEYKIRVSTKRNSKSFVENQHDVEDVGKRFRP